MAWVKIDDHLHAHPKIRRAWRADPASIGLYLLALSYASAYLTDGVVPVDFVCDQVPVSAKRKRILDALETAGLWERNGSGWIIHDYLEFNDSRAQIEKRRQADRDRKGRGG